VSAHEDEIKSLSRQVLTIVNKKLDGYTCQRCNCEVIFDNHLTSRDVERLVKMQVALHVQPKPKMKVFALLVATVFFSTLTGVFLAGGCVVI